MKKIFILPLMAVAAIFTGCFDQVEEYTINADNSGSCSVKVDMSKMIAFVEQIGGAESLKNDPNFSRLRDTVVYFKDYADTASELTADQKKWLRDAKLTVKSKLESKLLNMEFEVPFKNMNDWNKMYNQADGGIFGLMSKIMDAKSDLQDEEDTKEAEEDSEEMDEEKGKDDFGWDKLQTAYTTTFENGLIKRQVDAEKFEGLKDNEFVGKMMQMLAFIGDSQFTTVFKLPRAAKSTKGTAVELSADKKTVTLKYTLSKLLEDPSVGNFSVEY